jgi:hypothetical protein
MARHSPNRKEGDPIWILTNYSAKKDSINLLGQTQLGAEAILSKVVSPWMTVRADCVRKIPIEFCNAPPFHPIISRN